MTVMTVRVAGVALLAFFLPALAAQEECDDSAYIQRQADPVAPMTPAVPSASFMEVLAAAAPAELTCGADMYPFGGTDTNNPQCTTSTEGSPFSSSCTYEQFNNRVFESTCWWPFQAGTDYCADTFDGRASNQVTLEGLMSSNNAELAQVAEEVVDQKSACFTAMPAQLCPKYVCVSAGGPHRKCYETSGKSCQVTEGTSTDTVECSDWTVGQPFCLASLADAGQSGRKMPIQNFGIQWECCQSGGETGDPHISTMDGKHYTMLQEGTFKLWSLSNFSTEYLSSERHDGSVPKMKNAKVDWEVFVHYSTGRSFSKGLLLVDKSLGERRQVLELTSETCRWRSKMGEHGEWTPVEKPMPVFMADGVDFVTAFNLSSTGRKLATLCTLVDKVGIRSVTLQGREKSTNAALGAALTSPSPGVTDPGVHRFQLREWPILEAGTLFFFCVSTGDVKQLLTDSSASKAFLHLPLTNVAAASQDEAGWMILREDGKEIPAEELQNLWLEHRITLRVEFLEVPQSRRLRGSISQFI